jgi:hypothetical protein
MVKKSMIDEEWVIVKYIDKEKGIVAVSPYDRKKGVLTSGLTLITSIKDKKIKIIGEIEWTNQ